MGKAQRKDRWIMPQACLRRKFWQVARTSSRSATTPFEDKRSSSAYSRTEISKRMGLSSSDYANFEAGETHAHPRDIIAFCKIIGCHPLDLYMPEAGPKTALPDEIFYALALTIEDQSFGEEGRQRSWKRLQLEADRARARINEYWMEIKPLFLSLGFPVGQRTINIPLLPRSPDARQFMDRAMAEYELLLEEMLDGQQKELGLSQSQYDLNRGRLITKATKIFGENAELAITSLNTILQVSNDTKKLKDQFKKTPHILCPVKEGYLPEADDMSIFFERAKRNHSLFYRNAELKHAAVDTFKKIRNFAQWRDTPQTFALLDWYEHYSVIKELSDQMIRIRQYPGPASPA